MAWLALVDSAGVVNDSAGVLREMDGADPANVVVDTRPAMINARAQSAAPALIRANPGNSHPPQTKKCGGS